ncbi:MAG: hypothetical protein K6B41_15705 [Butyrivibrio sp.]|nr:hypothetical protein [Butyrivibrio sp.]
MKKAYKGEFGYIEYARKFSIIRTIICLVITIGIFIVGLIIYKSNKSAFSIIAALGCLPTGWSAVNMIMYLRAGVLKKESYKKIEAHKGGLYISYELEMTAYETNYHIGAATVLEKNVICYTDYKETDIAECEKHIHTCISQGGYSSYTVKVFNDIDKFCARLDQLEAMRAASGIDPKAIEDAWVAGTTETCAHILKSISL